MTLRLLLLASALIASPAYSTELRVSAQVVSVTPLTTQSPPVCDVPPPDRATGLAATLRWDLRGRCRDSGKPSEVTGYSVVYEWDGRRFATVLAEPPTGERLALRLHID